MSLSVTLLVLMAMVSVLVLSVKVVKLTLSKTLPSKTVLVTTVKTVFVSRPGLAERALSAMSSSRMLIYPMLRTLFLSPLITVTTTK